VRRLKRTLALTVLLLAAIGVEIATVRPGYTVRRATASEPSPEHRISDECESSTAWLREI
jgi:hypothetical protein